MGVTVLPESFFRPDISGIGRGIAGIVNPNQEMQEALRRALAANPQLAAQLAAAERVSPGLLKSLRIGGTEREAIAATPPSFGEILDTAAKVGFQALPEEDQRRFATAAALKMTPTQLATERALAPAIEQKGKEPGVAERGAVQALTGQTRGQIAQEELDMRLFGLANAYLATLPVSESMRGAAREKIPGMFAEEDFLMRLTLQTQLANANSARDFNEGLDRLREEDAQWWLRKSAVGDVAKWREYLHNPEARGKPEYAAIDKAFKAVGVENKVAEFTATSREITTMLDRLLGRGNIPKAPDEVKSLIAQQLNQAFARQAALGAPLFRAVLGPTGFLPGLARLTLPKGMEGKFKEIRFFDAQGNEVDPETIALVTSTPITNILQPTMAEEPPKPQQETPESIAARIRAKQR